METACLLFVAAAAGVAELMIPLLQTLEYHLTVGEGCFGGREAGQEMGVGKKQGCREKGSGERQEEMDW